MAEKKQANKSTRRDFLKKSGYVTGGVVGGERFRWIARKYNFGNLKRNVTAVATEVKLCSMITL